MKQWRIPVSWEMCGVVYCEADTLEEAMNIARDDEGIIPLPDDSSYIDESWKLPYDIDEIDIVRECFNDNQSDELKVK